jgi:hypothetical protein
MNKILMIIAIVCFTACSAISDVSNETFEEEYASSKMAHTMYSYEYLGEKDGQVYLKKKSMSIFNQKKWHTTIFVTSLSSLSKKVQQELRTENKKYEKHEN